MYLSTFGDAVHAEDHDRDLLAQLGKVAYPRHDCNGIDAESAPAHENQIGVLASAFYRLPFVSCWINAVAIRIEQLFYTVARFFDVRKH